MNFFKACQVLEIDSLQIYEICSDRKSLKRQYTKLALKYHPDKTQGDTTSKFQEIHEAYQYLNRLTVHGIKQEMNSNQADYNDYTHYEEDEDFHESDVPPSYMTLFKCFMGTLDDPVASKYLDIIATKILNVCEHQAIQLINKIESSTKFFVIYNILTKYKHVFHLSQSFYDIMEQKRIFWLEQSKMGHRRLAENYNKPNPFSCSDFDLNSDNPDTTTNQETEPRTPTEKEIFENHHQHTYESSDDENVDKLVLQPTLNDLWENNVYKYTKNGKTIIVPLWHHELIYDIDDNDFIIKMKPKLPSSNYWIDTQNNLHQLQEFTVSELWDHVVDESPISVFFGKKKFILYPHKLSLKTHQKWVWEQEGLTQIQNDSIYDISQKADVILHIHLKSIT